jgi:hypothetical protein
MSTPQAPSGFRLPSSWSIPITRRSSSMQQTTSSSSGVRTAPVLERMKTPSPAPDPPAMSSSPSPPVLGVHPQWSDARHAEQLHDQRRHEMQRAEDGSCNMRTHGLDVYDELEPSAEGERSTGERIVSAYSKPDLPSTRPLQLNLKPTRATTPRDVEVSSEMKDIDDMTTSDTVTAHLRAHRQHHALAAAEIDSEREAKKAKTERKEEEGESQTRLEVTRLRDDAKEPDGIMLGVDHLETRQMVVPQPSSFRDVPPASRFYLRSASFEPLPHSWQSMMQSNDAEWRFIQERVGKRARVKVSRSHQSSRESARPVWQRVFSC